MTAPTRGCCFYGHRVSEKKLRHPSFVLTDPFRYKKNERYLIVVNISSIKEDNPKYDRTCVLEKGDHPIITKKSYVLYDYKSAHLIPLSIFTKTFTIERQEPLSSKILIKICKGLMTSQDTLHSTQKAYQEAVKQNCAPAV